MKRFLTTIMLLACLAATFNSCKKESGEGRFAPKTWISDQADPESGIRYVLKFQGNNKLVFGYLTSETLLNELQQAAQGGKLPEETVKIVNSLKLNDVVGMNGQYVLTENEDGVSGQVTIIPTDIKGESVTVSYNELTSTSVVMSTVEGEGFDGTFKTPKALGIKIGKVVDGSFLIK